MRIEGELINAMLENTDESEQLPEGQIKYRQDNKSIMVGQGVSNTPIHTFPVDASTLAEFRSAMYPVGSFIYSFLDTSAFELEMGQNKWINVGDYQYRDSTHNKVLIKKTTDFGIYLGSANGYPSEIDGDGDDCWVWASDPTGRYLRVSGLAPNGDSLSNGQFLSCHNLEHNHYETIQHTRYVYHSQHHRSPSWPEFGNHDWDLRSSASDVGAINGYGNEDYAMETHNVYRGNAIKSGYTEARPESMVFNLYLKVNR